MSGVKHATQDKHRCGKSRAMRIAWGLMPVEEEAVAAAFDVATS